MKAYSATLGSVLRQFKCIVQVYCSNRMNISGVALKQLRSCSLETRYFRSLGLSLCDDHIDPAITLSRTVQSGLAEQPMSLVLRMKIWHMRPKKIAVQIFRGGFVG